MKHRLTDGVVWFSVVIFRLNHSRDHIVTRVQAFRLNHPRDHIATRVQAFRLNHSLHHIVTRVQAFRLDHSRDHIENRVQAFRLYHSRDHIATRVQAFRLNPAGLRAVCSDHRWCQILHPAAPFCCPGICPPPRPRPSSPPTSCCQFPHPAAPSCCPGLCPRRPPFLALVPAAPVASSADRFSRYCSHFHYCSSINS